MMELRRTRFGDDRNWQRIALPASIVLNLFLLALIGGHLWQSQRDQADASPSLDRALANAEATLSPKDAAAFAMVLHGDAPRYVAAAQQITAGVFTPAAVRQALAVWRAAWDRFLDEFSGPLIDAMAQLSPQGRRQLIAAGRSARPAISPP
jgi:Heavy-metal resistance